MVVSVKWDNEEHTIIRVVYYTEWTKAQQIEANRLGQTLLDEVEHSVNTIVDFRQLQCMPPDFFSIAPEIVHSAFFIHPNADKVIVVGAAKLLKHLSSVIAKVYKQTQGKFVHVDSLETAYNVLAEKK